MHQHLCTGIKMDYQTCFSENHLGTRLGKVESSHTHILLGQRAKCVCSQQSMAEVQHSQQSRHETQCSQIMVKLLVKVDHLQLAVTIASWVNPTVHSTHKFEYKRLPIHTSLDYGVRMCFGKMVQCALNG